MEKAVCVSFLVAGGQADDLPRGWASTPIPLSFHCPAGAHPFGWLAQRAKGRGGPSFRGTGALVGALSIPMDCPAHSGRHRAAILQRQP